MTPHATSANETPHDDLQFLPPPDQTLPGLGERILRSDVATQEIGNQLQTCTES